MDIAKVRAIDPPKCDCRDCALGEHMPFDSPHLESVLKAVLTNEIAPPENNLREGTLIIYETTQRVIKAVVDSGMGAETNYIILPAGGYDPVDENPSRSKFATVIDVPSISREHEDMQEHLINSLIAGAVYVNPSYSTYIAYRNPYGHTGLVELPNSDTSEVIILPYKDD